MTNNEYKKILKSKLSEKRYKHSLCVADEAVRLSLIFGGNIEKAYLAGLLHDIMKDASNEEQLQTFKKFGIILTNIEKSAPKLWHAMSGAVYVEKVLNISDLEILNAIRYHTTAKQNMSLLEKLIYLADLTAMDRDYNGVEEMRHAVSVNLEKAMHIGLAYTINDLATHGYPIHPDTIDAYNEVILEKNNTSAADSILFSS
ncbi:MAG: bis(5'-nucleosyl)-tetraphosphatase (symmetrical) YqeK [Oscillospiraceae bacterium]|nr:bis(5'-nucleosyl)-tetraphosphatase (symmetrical) YqeK [Oscillospiraceae bacterium]